MGCVVMVIMMIRLLLLVGLLERGRGGHRVVVAGAMVRVIQVARLAADAQVGAHRDGAALLVGGAFRLVPMVLEPVCSFDCLFVCEIGCWLVYLFVCLSAGCE